jgi:hypothetical protein
MLKLTIYVYALCDSFLHGSPNTTSISGVKGEEEVGESDMRLLKPSSKDFIISLGEHFAICQGM